MNLGLIRPDWVCSWRTWVSRASFFLMDRPAPGCRTNKIFSLASLLSISFLSLFSSLSNLIRFYLALSIKKSSSSFINLDFDCGFGAVICCNQTKPYSFFSFSFIRFGILTAMFLTIWDENLSDSWCFQYANFRDLFLMELEWIICLSGAYWKHMLNEN